MKPFLQENFLDKQKEKFYQTDVFFFIGLLRSHVNNILSNLRCVILIVVLFVYENDEIDDFFQVVYIQPSKSAVLQKLLEIDNQVLILVNVVQNDLTNQGFNEAILWIAENQHRYHFWVYFKQVF